MSGHVDLFDFYGLKSNFAFDDDTRIPLPLGEVVTTVTIDLDQPLGEDGLTKYGCKTECHIL